MPLSGLLSKVWPFSELVHIDGLDEYVKTSHAEPWHIYAIKNRYRRHHVCLACNWLYKTVEKDALIYEPGCGSGINLLWFGKRGFSNLKGCDLSPEAVDLSGLLARHLGIEMDIWQDNAYTPQVIPKNIGALLSVNWLYHIEGVTLEHFLATYRPFMAAGGKATFDMVDASYNEAQDNEYHTDDLVLPKEQRRVSEYKLRMSPDEIKKVVHDTGFTVLDFSKPHGHIPRTVWLVQAS